MLRLRSEDRFALLTAALSMTVWLFLLLRSAWQKTGRPLLRDQPTRAAAARTAAVDVIQIDQ